MKKTILLMTLLLISSFCTTASATVDANNLQQNPYQTLKNAFDSAGPAKMEDYPRVTDFGTAATKLTCVSSGGGDLFQGTPNILANALVGRFNYVIPGTPAQPGNGPLFPGTPGTPDKTVTTLSMILTGNGPVSDFDVYTVYLNCALKMPVIERSASGDLQAKTNSDTVTLVTTYRKKGNELFFHDHGDEPSAGKTSDIYGYCYPSK